MTDTRSAWGWGLACVHASGQVLDTWFPDPRLGPASTDDPPAEVAAARGDDPVRGTRTEPVLVEIDLDAPRPAPPTPTCGCTC